MMTITLPPPTEARRLACGDVTLGVHDIGSGPAVVLLHGAGPGATSLSNFGQNVPALAAHFRLLLVDHPGYGASDRPEFARDKSVLAVTADAIAVLLDQLGVQRAHLIGNSLGGGTALTTALRHPERVGRLLLMGPAGAAVPLFSEPLSEGLRLLTDLYRAPQPDRARLEAFVRVMVHDQRLVTDELLEQRWAAASDPDVFAAQQRVNASFTAPPPDEQLWRSLHRVNHEVLLTWGREDRVLPLDWAFFALRRMPNARLHVFPRCGHWAQVERRAEFDRLAIDFLGAEE
jgi:4,5:9,10-diseco-3-hydroxy-5,9,17-trioxoandrosta-1(10),2-diene-4-oate hydrolase